MGILLRKIDVVTAVCQSTSCFYVHLYRVTASRKNLYKTATPVDLGIHNPEQILRAPVILLVSGYGVLCREREDDAPVLNRVLSDTKTFFYKEKGRTLSFIRREQLERVSGLLEKSNIELCDIDLVTGEITPEIIERHAQQFVKNNITFRRILTPGRTGSVIAGCIYKNIRLYVLALFVLLLILNLFLKGLLEKEYGTQAAELSALRKQSEQLQEVALEKERIGRVFRDNIPWKYGMLCDYLGAVVPPDIILKRMGVQPLMKTLSNGESPAVRTNTILVSGYASRPEQITFFMQNIEKEEYAQKVRLKEMRQDKENGNFTFTIEILI